MSVPDRFDPKIYSKSFPRFSVNRGKDHQQVDRSESNTLRTRLMPAGLRWVAGAMPPNNSAPSLTVLPHIAGASSLAYRNAGETYESEASTPSEVMHVSKQFNDGARFFALSLAVNIVSASNGDAAC